MKALIKARKYPRVVKDMIFDKETKRYVYVYYRDDELEAILRQERGDDWYTEPWVQVWMSSQKYRPVRYRKRSKKKQVVQYPPDIIQELVYFYKQQGYRKGEVRRILKQQHHITQNCRFIIDKLFKDVTDE